MGDGVEINSQLISPESPELRAEVGDLFTDASMRDLQGWMVARWFSHGRKEFGRHGVPITGLVFGDLANTMLVVVDGFVERQARSFFVPVPLFKARCKTTGRKGKVTP